MFVTSAFEPVSAAPTPLDDRMDKLEAMIAGLATAVKASRKTICGNFRKTGTCAYGDKCKFEHSGYQPSTAAINVIGHSQGQPSAYSGCDQGLPNPYGEQHLTASSGSVFGDYGFAC
jgi:hypothetical protein